VSRWSGFTNSDTVVSSASAHRRRLAAFFGGATPLANGVYRVRVDVGGSAFIYSTTTDNRTNDTAIRFLTRPR